MPGPPSGEERIDRETGPGPVDNRSSDEPDAPPETVLHPDGEKMALEGHPQSIGRFRVEDVLGAGGFGSVYLAYDGELDRRVAIKVPHRNRVAAPDDLKQYLDEARTVAALDHPGIVPVYDVGQTPDGLCYVVSRYIDGENLGQWMATEHPGAAQAVQVVATLAETLHFVHGRGIVHRDIKPGNILRDSEGNLFVADFGLALQDHAFASGPRTGGTPAYMSPEQARGEGHLVDGRSDIFALGAVLYEMLTGTRPFRGPNQTDVIHQILHIDPRPVRQLNDRVSRELARICQKALAKRASDRYATGHDFAEDLRRCPDVQVSEHSDPGTADDVTPSDVVEPSSRLKPPVVPKGLRAYEGQDAHFFRDLMPGPRDADGLPESIRFWKSRIDPQPQPDSFRVGVLYGPSGCGKSSFVRAGLLPVLDPNVVVSIVNATPAETSQRIREATARQIGGVDVSLSLPQLLSAIRKRDWSDGRKLLIVLDQFEQWLHAASDEERAEVVAGLRQCDGDHLQCLLLVRDDFWLAVTRFLFDLEIELDSSRNLAVVDLFDKPHARKVLGLFGRAFGRLPVGDPAAGQTRFIRDAVDALAENDRVVPIRLSVFAEMVKSRDWTPATLHELGGVEGVGVRFLEECFDMSTSPAERRVHQSAAQAVLKKMLPDSGVIRGPSQSGADLLAASGYADRRREFDSLLRILDSELRIITPVEREQTSVGEQREKPDTQAQYQLTHDFLIPAIRQWVTRKQQSTVRGRAQLRLAERADVWAAKPEPRQLPSWTEWPPILLWTDRRTWSPSELRVMRAATRRRLTQILCLIVVVLLAAWGAWQVNGRLESRALVRQLSTADVADVPAIFEQIDAHQRWIEPALGLLAADEAATDRARLFACLTLPTLTPERTRFVVEQIRGVDFATLQLICRFPPESSGELQSALWDAVHDENLADSERFRVALALASFEDADSQSGGAQRQSLAGLLSAELVSESLQNPYHYRELVGLASPLRHVVVHDLMVTVHDRNDAERRGEAIRLLTDLLENEPVLLTDLMLELPPEILSRILPVIDQHPGDLVDLLVANASRDPDKESDSVSDDSKTHRRANAGALLFRLNRPEVVWDLFRFVPDDDTQPYLIHSISVLGGDASVLLERYDQEDDASARRGLLFAVGDVLSRKPESPLRGDALRLARSAFQDESDAGVHTAARWLLHQLDDGDWIRERQSEWAAGRVLPDSQWRVTDDGTTWIMLNAENDPRVGATFEIASAEVTVGQYLRFRPDADHPNELSPGDDCPVNVVQWYDAVAYCRWLTTKAGLGEEEMCYPPPEPQNPTLIQLHPNYRQRRGYRLPTAAEWEFACRAGAESPLSFGRNEALRGQYACLFDASDESEERAWPVGRFKPNPYGLFNMLGNVREWCSDADNDGRREVRGSGYGGYWEYLPEAISEGVFTPTIRFYSVGFRIARSLPEE